MKTFTLSILLLAAPGALAQAPPPLVTPDPPPLERRVSDLERRVALLEKGARPDPMPDLDAKYADALARVLSGGGGAVVLAVGVPPPLEYAVVYEFPADYRGIPAGIWDCFRGDDGQPRMRLRVTHTREVTAYASPFRRPSTPTTFATGAGGPSTFSPAPAPGPGRIPTLVGRVGLFGSTDGCLTGG